jgi:hypothetical protein
MLRPSLFKKISGWKKGAQMRFSFLSMVVVLLGAFLLGGAANATTVNSSVVSVAPSTITSVFKLVESAPQTVPAKKVQVVVTDHGLSTDLSPRYSAILSFSSFAEMGNITADFEITNHLFNGVSAKRLKPGIYEVSGVEYGGETATFANVAYTIDARQMFSDEISMRKFCGGDFCDGLLKTKVEVSKSIRSSK